MSEVPTFQPQIEYFDPHYETMPKDQLDALTFERFKREIDHAYETNAFYRRKFDEHGVTPADVTNPSETARLPVSTKAELIADTDQYPPFGSRHQSDEASPVLVIETGGSSAQGQEAHPLSASEIENVYVAEAYGFFWAGARPGGIVAQTFPVSLGGAGLFWHGAVHTKIRSGIMHLGNYDTETKLRKMAHYRANVLIATGPYLRRLEHVADLEGIRLTTDLGIRSIITLGEGASREWVRTREEMWGARLFEHYGCTQRAFFGTCEYGMLPEGRRGIVHFLPHMCYVEVVNTDTYRHAQRGEEGELVITPIGSDASPLIRFKTGDRARFMKAEDCPCGRPFDGVESCSIGRADDMIKVKGVNIWQNVIDSVILAHAEVVEYAGRVFVAEDGKEVARVDVEFNHSVQTQTRKTLLTTIRAALATSTGLGFDVEQWTGSPLLDHHEKSTQRKHRRWVDERWEN